MKVRFVASDPFGGGNLRSFWPSAALAQRGYETRCEMYTPKPVVGEYDAIIVHRPLFLSFPDKLMAYRRVGFKVFVDEDDDLTRIHQTKNEIGLQEWVPSAVAAHDIAMTIADGITVSTPQLAEVYGKLNPNVHVCRNYLPGEFGAVKWYGRKRSPDVRVHWAGITQTHRHDLEWIAPVFDGLMRGAMFSTIGDRKTPNILGYGGAYEVSEFVADPLELYQHMARGDIGIVPLLPNEFNEAKSWLKALEYLTVGVPIVATDLPEQRALITHGVEGFLAKTPEEFRDYVQMLVWDPAMREDMSVAARKRGKELRIEDQAGGWESALASVLSVGV